MFALTDVERAGMEQAAGWHRLLSRASLLMADRQTHTFYSTVSSVLDMVGPTFGGAREDVTTPNSEGWAEYLTVQKTGGVLEFDVILSGAHADLWDASQSQSVEYFMLSLPGELTLVFTALVEIQFNARAAGLPRAHIRLILTGVCSRE